MVNPTDIVIKWNTLADIKISKSRFRNKIEEHPQFPYLLSITDTLDHFKIPHAVLQIENKDFELIKKIPLPFLAYRLHEGDNAFVVVSNFEDSKVVFHHPDKGKQREKWHKFSKAWTGISIVKTSTNKIVSPDYIKDKLLELTPWIAIGLLTAFMIISFFLNKVNLLQAGVESITLIGGSKIVGLLICTILILSETNSQANKIAQSICGPATGNNNCISISSSSGGTFLNLISWSDLGFFYFLGGTLSLVLNVNWDYFSLLSGFLLINVPTLFFSLYSVYYQKFVAKSWCKFCIIIITLFWIEFAALSISGFKYFSTVDIKSLYSFLLLYLGIGLTLILYKQLTVDSSKLTNLKHQLNKFKLESNVFQALNNQSRTLQAYPKEIGISAYENGSPINSIVVVTNPFCKHCESIYKFINEITEMKVEDLSIKILFTVNQDEESVINKIVTDIYHVYYNTGIEILLKLLLDWSSVKHKSVEEWKKQLQSNGLISQNSVSKKLEKHFSAVINWCEKENVFYTPTIYFNGKELHKNYDITDLSYFIKK